MFPFHTWLPDAHTEAPTVGSVLLAAILLKLGTYGFIRIALPILPEAAAGLGAVDRAARGDRHHLRRARAVSRRRDMKRLIAFSSVAHMGFVMLGIATLTDFGINAAIFGMVAHGLITGMLFFVAGSVQERYGTREMSRLGGLLTQAPKMGWILGFCGDGVARPARPRRVLGRVPGDPVGVQPARPTGSRRRADSTFRTYMVIAADRHRARRGYLLWMYQRVAFGSRRPSSRTRTSTTSTSSSGSRGRRCCCYRGARHLPATSSSASPTAP